MRKWIAAIVWCTACALAADAGATNPPVVVQQPVPAPTVLLSKQDAMVRVAKLSLSALDKRPSFGKLIPAAPSPAPTTYPHPYKCSAGGTYTLSSMSVSQGDPTAAAIAGTPTSGRLSMSFTASQCQTSPGMSIDTGGAAFTFALSVSSATNNSTATRWMDTYRWDGPLTIANPPTIVNNNPDPKPGTYVFRNLTVTVTFDNSTGIPQESATLNGAVVVDGNTFTFNNESVPTSTSVP